MTALITLDGPRLVTALAGDVTLVDGFPWPPDVAPLPTFLRCTPPHLHAAAAAAVARIAGGVVEVETDFDLATLGGGAPRRPGWYVVTGRGTASALWADLVVDEGEVVLGWWWATLDGRDWCWPETVWDERDVALELDALRALLGVDARGLTGAREVLGRLAH